MTLPVINQPKQDDRIAAVLQSMGLPQQPSADDLRLTPGGRLREILGNSTKLKKGLAVDVLSRVLYLSPSTEAGINTCPKAGDCASQCIRDVGRMAFDQSTRSRVMKTLYLHFYPDQFLAQLRGEALRHARKAQREGLTPAIRLNGTSDLPWEHARYGGILDHLIALGIEVYDYTKLDPNKRNRRTPAGYHLTYSLSEDPGSWDIAKRWLRVGGNVAMVVSSVGGTTLNDAKAAQDRLLAQGSFAGFPVVSGDETDARFLDPAGHLVILHAKGPAVRDSSGFVVRV